MLSRRLAPVLLLAVLSGGFWWAANRLVLGPSAESGETARSLKAVDEHPTNATGVSSAARVMIARPEAAATGPSELSVDAASILAEEVALQLLAADASLQLSPAEWSAFAAVTSHHQAIRQAYEASVATASVAGRGRYRIDIPAYPGAGDALREKLYAELREKLGERATEAIAQQMGASLESHFGGFGVSVQTLEFTADPGRVESDYQVTRTVTFWNNVDAKERLTTRRETHFPGLEDPAGHQWGPFLSLLATRVAERAGS